MGDEGLKSKTGMRKNELMVIDNIQSQMHTIHSIQVIIDSDFAELYRAEVWALNQAVKMNLKRFPERFRFQLTAEEYNRSRSQIVTIEKEGDFSQNVISNFGEILQSKFLTSNWSGRLTNPYAFAEQSVAMLGNLEEMG